MWRLSSRSSLFKSIDFMPAHSLKISKFCCWKPPSSNKEEGMGFHVVHFRGNQKRRRNVASREDFKNLHCKSPRLWLESCCTGIKCKDKIIFVTEEDHSPPEETVELEEEPAGVLLPNGEINWDCPCLGGRADGPCGEQFKEAFSCFVRSSREDSEERGASCLEAFHTMYQCEAKFPDRYPDLPPDPSTLTGDSDLEESTSKS